MAETMEAASGRTNVGEVERWVSVAVGGLLAAAALRRGGLGGAILAATGAMLVKRGVTGHCDVYEAVGVDTAEVAGGAAPTDRRETYTRREARPEHRDPVTEASEESFPASDPPSYTPTSSLGPPDNE
jgi:hypothetical protein